MTSANWISLIAMAVPVFTLALTVYRGGKGDSAQLASMLSKLEYLSQDIREIKLNMRRYDDDSKEFRERLAKVEASAAQAHKRLDTIATGAHTKEKP